MCFCPIHPPTHRLVDRCLTKGHVVECTVHEKDYHEPRALCVKCEAAAILPEKQKGNETEDEKANDKEDEKEDELEQFIGYLLLLLVEMGIMVLLGRAVAKWMHEFQTRGEPTETCCF